MAKRKKSAADTQPAIAPAAVETSPEKPNNPQLPPEGEFEVKPPPQLEARISMRESLAQTAQRMHTEESGDLPPEETPAPGDEPPDETPAPGDEPPAVEVEAAKPKRKLVVNGQEQEVDEDRVIDAGIRALQKQGAADENLRLANERLKQATDLLEEARQRGALPKKETDTVELSDQDADVDTLARAIQFGTEEEVKGAVKTLLDRGRSAGTQHAIPSADAIVAQVTDLMDFNTAIASFQTGQYKDLWNDPKLRQLVFNEDIALQKEIAEGKREPMTYVQRFSEAGRLVNEWRAKFGQPGKPSVVVDSQRQVNKANAGTPPTAGARPAGAPTAQPTPPSASSIVADMRRQRGQAT